MRSERRLPSGAGAVLASALVFCLAGPAQSADDESIKGVQRLAIKQAVGEYVRAHDREGRLLHYDAAAGEVLRLRFLSVHPEIEKKGDFYVSCADFAGTDGKKVDLDFLVLRDGDAFIVNQTVVHGVDGKKRNFYLDMP